MDMIVEKNWSDDKTKLRLKISGEFDSKNVSQLLHIWDEFSVTLEELTIDLNEVDKIDSGAISFLFSLREPAKEYNFIMNLSVRNTSVRDTLRIMHAEDYFNLL